MKLLEKLQSLPLGKRKIVLWVSVAVIGLIFVVAFLLAVSLRFKSFDFRSFGRQLNLPSFEEVNFSE
ncbi:MAG: hypothetical protein COT37_02420 [Parcubacteria group bacterium CG08_land_8_20_14_0_20_43_9]|nr:MAG: hypothetical protein COT37_02420 [Parcubacteria group bacterium CG08_land_8_20_14_0_20_43_9]